MIRRQCRQAGRRKVVSIHATKYAVPRQINRNSRGEDYKKQKKLKYCLYFLLTVKKKIIIVSFRYNSSVLIVTRLRTQPPYGNASAKSCFRSFFSIFESGGITKHLMTGSSGNNEVCFSSTSMFLERKPRGALRVSGKENSLFPLAPVIKCLFIPLNNYSTHASLARIIVN